MPSPQKRRKRPAGGSGALENHSNTTVDSRKTSGAQAAEPTPLTFVRLTDLAQQLPGRQLNALIGLLRFCWTTPRCWPTQETLAELRHCSVGKINRGIHE